MLQAAVDCEHCALVNNTPASVCWPEINSLDEKLKISVAKKWKTQNWSEIFQKNDKM